MNLIANTTSVIVPTYNADLFAKSFITGLKRQTLCVSEVIVLDSESTDGSLEQFRNALYSVTKISRPSFRHGGTRNIGLQLAGNVDFIVFLTQDAILEDTRALERLIEPFSDPTIGIVFGRQLPRAAAAAIERHARSFNYPVDSAVRAVKDASQLGIKTIFNSNSFAAYRTKVLNEIGGFPPDVIMGEDQVAAARALLLGWKIAYAANATVVHSHDYDITAEFRRYFDVGVLHASQPFLIERFGNPAGEGGRFVQSELKYLIRRAPCRMPEAILRSALKYVGYKMGCYEHLLPAAIKRRLAMQSSYFNDHWTGNASIGDIND